jgi:hypothetical protein
MIPPALPTPGYYNDREKQSVTRDDIDRNIVGDRDGLYRGVLAAFAMPTSTSVGYQRAGPGKRVCS